MTKPKRILAEILSVVSNETDVSEGRIMSSCGDMETVDARWICVKLLRESGLYTSRIAELMRISPRYVQYILTDFEDRVTYSKIMRKDYENAKKHLRITGEQTR